MGYYTRFEGDVRPTVYTRDSLETLDYVRDRANELTDGKFMSDETFKWYDWESDMVAVSDKFPDWLFTLEGEGEDNEDVWCAYFLAGKRVVHKMPKWTPPPFSEKDLR
jgi:hypothetical protein